MVEIRVVCTYCGETLTDECNDAGILVSDDFHSCFGETVGYIGEFDSKGILLADDAYEIRFE